MGTNECESTGMTQPREMAWEMGPSSAAGSPMGYYL